MTYEQDARGNRVTYTLNDDNGLVSKVTSPAPSNLIGNSTVETTYSYNDRNPYLLGSEMCIRDRDKSIFMETISHEGECFLFPKPGEDISDVISKNGWIKTDDPIDEEIYF